MAPHEMMCVNGGKKLFCQSAPKTYVGTRQGLIYRDVRTRVQRSAPGPPGRRDVTVMGLFAQQMAAPSAYVQMD